MFRLSGKQKLEENSWLFLWGAILGYIILFTLLSITKYNNFLYNANDFAIFSQVFFNTAQGNWLDGTVNLNKYLADHFTPIIFLLLPFYKLWPRPENLLFLQSLFLALAAWPLYKISFRLSQDKIIALLVSGMWLCSPYVQTANLFEFHLLSFAPFFIFWTFYFYQQNNYKFFLLFFLLALLIREDISFIMIAFAALSYWDKRTTKWKATSLFLPIISFLLSVKIVDYYAIDGGYKFFIYYGWLGGHDMLSIILSWLKHPLELLAHILSPKNFASAIVILLPMLFLPFLRARYLIFALIPLLQFILTSSGLNFMSYSSHYVLFFMPALFLTLIYALDKIKNKSKFVFSEILYKNYSLGKILLFITIIYFSIFLSPAKEILFRENKNLSIKNNQHFLTKISENSKVVASLNLLPQLSNRKIIYPLSYAYFGSGQFAFADFDLPQVDYILVDYDQFLTILIDAQDSPFLQEDLPQMPDKWREKLKDYKLVKAKDNMYLWADKDADTSMDLVFYKIANKSIEEGDGFLVATQQQENLLALSFYNAGDYQEDYLIRFYSSDNSYDIPLDYGILPPSKWSDDKIYTFYYYPSDEILSWQIFTWQGENKLGYQKEVMADLKLRAITEKKDL